jgi:hypothetical protein
VEERKYLFCAFICSVAIAPNRAKDWLAVPWPWTDTMIVLVQLEVLQEFSEL